MLKLILWVKLCIILTRLPCYSAVICSLICAVCILYVLFNVHYSSYCSLSAIIIILYSLVLCQSHVVLVVNYQCWCLWLTISAGVFLLLFFLPRNLSQLSVVMVAAAVISVVEESV